MDPVPVEGIQVDGFCGDHYYTDHIDFIASNVTISSSTTNETNLETNHETKKLKDASKQSSSEWYDSTGLKVKQFNASELEAFRKPFESGWRREIVLRGTTTNSGKKIGDVYYFSPDKHVKLRSYVEMGLYLKKHPNCGLEPENFTFARQPIFESPQEIVRHAMPKSRNESTETKVSNHEKKSHPKKNNQTDESTGEETPKTFSGKRKRVAPSRFENEEYLDKSPFKKKTKVEKAEKAEKANDLESSSKVGQNESKNSSNGASKSSILAQPSSSQLSQPTTIKKSTGALPSSTSSVALSTLSPHPTRTESPPESTSDNIPSSPPPISTQSPTSPSNAEPTKGQDEKNSQPRSPQSTTPEGSEQPQEVYPIGDKGTLPEENKTDQSTEAAQTSSEPEENSKPQITETNTSITTTPAPPSRPSTTDKPKKSNSGSSKSSKKKSENKSSKSKSDKAEKGDKTEKPDKPEKMDRIDKIDKNSEADIVSTIIGSIPEDILNHVQLGVPAPCSIMCNGKKGMLPTLLCSRCLCLFHPECVPCGIFLDDPHRFICPNCIQPDELDKQIGSIPPNTINGSAASDLDYPPITNGSRLSKGKCGPMIQSGIKSRNFSGLPKISSNLTAGFGMDSMPNVQYGNYFNHVKPKHSLSQCGDDIPGFLPHSYDSLYRNYYSTRGFKHRLQGQNGQYHQSHQNRHRKMHSENRSQANQGSSTLHPSIAPIAPIKYTASRIADFIQEKINKYRSNLAAIKPEFTILSNGYECLNQVFQHLSTRDLVKVKLVSRTFNSLASQPFLWQKIRLKGLAVKDWQYFGRNIVEPQSAQDIDFDGIRCPPGSDISEMWSNFPTIIDYLKSVKHLRFGLVPTSVIDEIVNAAVTENCYNSFSNLETLMVRHLFEQDSHTKQCDLSLIEQIGYLSSLQNLQIDCKYGLIVSPDDSHLLNRAFAPMTNLRSLSITTLKGFNAEQFSFLSHLKSLESLEIGSCENWINYDEARDTNMENKTSPSSSSQQSSPAEKPDYLSEPMDQDEDSSTRKDKRNDTESDQEKNLHTLKGGFKYLSELTQLKHLKLCEVIIDETSNQLSLSLQRMRYLRDLHLQDVTISPDASQTLHFLATTIKSHLKNLIDLTFATDDPHTNKCVFQVLKKLDSLQHVTWKVGVNVEDSGQCLVPFLKERGEESEMEEDNVDLTNGDNLEMMDLDHLNKIIQSNTLNYTVDIIPQ